MICLPNDLSQGESFLKHFYQREKEQSCMVAYDSGIWRMLAAA